MDAVELITRIIESGSKAQKRALFIFTDEDDVNSILYKFELFVSYFAPKFVSVEQAPFHVTMKRAFVEVLLGQKHGFVNLGFRKSGKTVLTKLFIAFVILCDYRTEHKKFIKVISSDLQNSTQITTDVYNFIVSQKVQDVFDDVFDHEGKTKREERMSSFTTKRGVKVLAVTVGKKQRGHAQDEARPDFVIFEDIEDRTTLRSLQLTQNIWLNINEALDGMQKARSGWILNGNYISESGNIHKFVMLAKDNPDHYALLNVPIIKNGEPTWPAMFTVEEIKRLLDESPDPEGEYLSQPSAARDIFFPRKKIEEQLEKFKEEPESIYNGLRIYEDYIPTHRYAIGVDTSEGIGKDSNAAVIIDFGYRIPKVVAVYNNNKIPPDLFAAELVRYADMYGMPIIAVEANNYSGGVVVTKLAELYKEDRLFRHTDPFTGRESNKIGWFTTPSTKSKMLHDLRTAIETDEIIIPDESLLEELKSYTIYHLTERNENAMLATRHFDLVIALAIAWQMQNVATISPLTMKKFKLMNKVLHKMQNNGINETIG